MNSTVGYKSSSMQHTRLISFFTSRVGIGTAAVAARAAAAAIEVVGIPWAVVAAATQVLCAVRMVQDNMIPLSRWQRKRAGLPKIFGHDKPYRRGVKTG